MSDAPERIWACADIDDHTNPATEDWDCGSWDIEKPRGGKGWHEYVRADRLRAVEAERDALREAREWAEAALRWAREYVEAVMTGEEAAIRGGLFNELRAALSRTAQPEEKP